MPQQQQATIRRLGPVEIIEINPIGLAVVSQCKMHTRAPNTLAESADPKRCISDRHSATQNSDSLLFNLLFSRCCCDRRQVIGDRDRPVPNELELCSPESRRRFPLKATFRQAALCEISSRPRR